MTYRLQQFVEPRGGELIGRGIASFGEAMGRGIERSAELKAESSRYTKLLEAMGMDSGAVAAMSLGAKRGAADAMALKRAEELHTRQRDEDERFRKAMALTRSPESGGPRMPMAEAMGMTGVTDPKLIQAGLSLHEAMDGAREFRPQVIDLGDGVKAMTTSDRSAVPLRDAMDPGAIQFIQAPNGTYVVQDARGGVKQLRAQQDEGSAPSLADAVMAPGGEDMLKDIRKLREVHGELLGVARARPDARFGWPWDRRSKADELRRLQTERLGVIEQLRSAGVTVGNDGAIMLRGRAIDRLDGVAAPEGAAQSGSPARVIDFNDLPVR